MTTTNYGFATNAHAPATPTAGPQYAQNVDEALQAIDDGAFGLTAFATGADDTAMLNAAVAIGPRVFSADPAYALSSTGVAIPPGVELRGKGSQSGVHTYSGSGTAFNVGNAVLGTAVAYGDAIEDLGILLSNSAATGIETRETVQANLRKLYLQGQPGGANTGVFANGGENSSWFSVYDSVVANHMKTGFRFGTTHATGQAPTSALLLACSAFGDDEAGSVGFQWDEATGSQTLGAGNGSVVVGGNSEHTATAFSIHGALGISAAGRISIFGHRFESNVVDVNLGVYATATSWFGCQGLDNVSNSSGLGFDSHTFWGCHKSDGTPYPNRAVGQSTFKAFAASDPILTTAGVPSQNGNHYRARNNADQTVFAVDYAGQIATVNGWGILITANGGSPEGAVTAIPGSYCADTTNGEGYIKKSGSGNTGWKLITHA